MLLQDKAPRTLSTIRPIQTAKEPSSGGKTTPDAAHPQTVRAQKR